MTLKTWLSGGHKPTKAAVVASDHQVRPGCGGGGGLKNPFSSLTRSTGQAWRVRSVEDVGEAESGDYGFLEYYSLRRTASRDTALTCGTWSHLSGSWGPWAAPGPAQFYPSTLNRSSKSGQRRDHRPRSYHLDEIWRSDDIRTSTPLLSPAGVLNDPPQPPAIHPPPEQQESGRRGVVKRNSLLWRLRPDKWRSLEGSLRRARSRDDGLDDTCGRRKNDLAASQPDLLTSHRAPGHAIHCDLVPPAPLSILPPTTRRAAHSETLPRRSRHSSRDSSGGTLLARGRRWLHGASLGRADRIVDRAESELTVTVPQRPVPGMTPNITVTMRNNMTPNRSASLMGDTVRCNNHKNTMDSLGVRFRSGLNGENELKRRSRGKDRRPRTFYLLEDYLSPVRPGGVAAGVELDEYISRAPRLVFREAPHETPSRPLPPTPEWDTPSLSPPASLVSGRHPTPPPRPPATTVFVDAIIPSPEKSGNASLYSPVFSPRDSGYPRFVTPELALTDRAPYSHIPQSHTPQTHTHNQTTFTSLDRHQRRRSRESAKSPASAHHHHHHHKDASLHKLGRNASSTNRPPLSSKLRQNGLISAQKLPVLTNKSNSSSRVNLPHDASSRTSHNYADGDTGGGGRNRVEGSGNVHISGVGQGGAGSLPILNNNKGETDSPRPSRLVSGGNKHSSSSRGDDSPSHNKPLSPQDALKTYGDLLTEYERREIEAYPEVYYLGVEARKIHGEEGAQLNGGYDDENGSYNKVMHDHISYRYEILEVIGKGSFGQVIRAIDHRTGEHVAIKIIRNKKRFHHQALVEVKILDHLRRRDQDQHHSVIHMLDYFYFRNHLCITFELMGLNLYELIKKNNYQGFSLSLIKRFAFSLVQCLKLLHRENIIHCDLKPENVLLKQRGSSSIRIIDFGSSCYVHQRVYTYIQSRFYRSPEVILGLPYGLPIDMWSLGCILAELYTGYPLFPGENEVEQLACIMEVLTLPPHHLLIAASRRRLFFDSKGSPRCVTNSKGKKRRPGSRDLSSVLKCSDQQFVHFIGRCLEWDPSTRMTPEEALQHDWLRSTTLSSSSVGGGGLVNGGGPRRSGPITQESTEDDNYTLYKVYKGKRHREVSTTVTEAGSKPDNTSSSTDATITTTTTISTTMAATTTTSNTTNGNPDGSTSTENSLNDSGTFLPPIL